MQVVEAAGELGQEVEAAGICGSEEELLERDLGEVAYDSLPMYVVFQDLPVSAAPV